MTTAGIAGFKPRERRLLLYILGWGRSGSSVLANILGSMDQAASLGEVRYLWERGLLKDGTCGCGAQFSACDFWPNLAPGATRLRDMTPARARSLARTIGNRARPAQLPAILSARARSAYLRHRQPDLDLLMQTYEAAFEASGARVLIDASKSPFHAVNLLYEKRDFDVAFLHLVRDPRGVMHSWKKIKLREDTSDRKFFPRYSSMRSFLQWTFSNAQCEKFARFAPQDYYLVRYEDLAEDWHAALLSGAGPLFDTVPEVCGDRRTAMVRAQHSITGNPSRFNLGEITLSPDVAWRGNLTRLDQTLARLICRSVAARHGYAM